MALKLEGHIFGDNIRGSLLNGPRSAISPLLSSLTLTNETRGHILESLLSTFRDDLGSGFPHKMSSCPDR